jgi:hypothetical protein
MYSRAQPSPRYQSLLRMYAEMHVHGEAGAGTSAAETFEGISLIPHVHTVRRLIASTGAQNVLDYGAGKASLYGLRNFLLPGETQPIESVQDYWDVDYVEFYDPGYAPYSRLPAGTYHGVICTDVMEHCPEEDLPWILGEIFAYAERFVFLTIARYPALKRLPNGENAHITIKPVEWWSDLIGQVARPQPELRWEARVEEIALADPVRLVRQGVTLRGGPID